MYTEREKPEMVPVPEPKKEVRRLTQRERAERRQEKADEAFRKLVISDTAELALVRRIATQLERIWPGIRALGHEKLAVACQKAKETIGLELLILNPKAKPIANQFTTVGDDNPEDPDPDFEVRDEGRAEPSLD